MDAAESSQMIAEEQVPGRRPGQQHPRGAGDATAVISMPLAELPVRWPVATGDR